MSKKKQHKRAIRVHAHARVNAYGILSRAVEEGTRYGWSRAHKYTDNPSEDTILNAIQDMVMAAISDVFIFEHEEY